MFPEGIHSLSLFQHGITEVSLPLGVSCEELTPVKREESSSEDSTVTLSYKYSKKAAGGDGFFWYRQYPGKPPEFLISHYGTGAKLLAPVSRMSFKVSEDTILPNYE